MAEHTCFFTFSVSVYEVSKACVYACMGACMNVQRMHACLHLHTSLCRIAHVCASAAEEHKVTGKNQDRFPDGLICT